MASAAQAIELARDQLNDPGATTWTAPYMLRAVAAAQRTVVQLVPNAYARRVSIALVANDAVQALPAEAVRLIDVFRNLGSGSTPGKRITLTSEEQLARVDPNWHASTPATAIAHYTYDRDLPQFFCVYPRPKTALVVDAVVSQVPPAPNDANSTLALGDQYLNAIVQGVLWNAWQANSERRDTAKAGAAYQAMLQELGLKKQADAETDPDVKAAQ